VSPRFFTVLPALLFFSGCSIFLEAKISVVLPEIPEVWESLGSGVSFLCIYKNSAGEKEEVHVPPETSSILLRISRACNTPVLVYPLGEGLPGDFLRPGGALFPHDIDGSGELVCSWERGFAADCFFTLGDLGIPTEKINGERFIQGILDSGEKDPWSLDKERIIRVLRFSTFRADQIKPLPLFSLEIPFKPGIYVRDSPFSPGFSVHEGEPPVIKEISPGYHYFINCGDKSVTRVFCSGKEWFIFLPDRVSVLSGRW